MSIGKGTCLFPEREKLPSDFAKSDIQKKTVACALIVFAKVIHSYTCGALMWTPIPITKAFVDNNNNQADQLKEITALLFLHHVAPVLVSCTPRARAYYWLVHSLSRDQAISAIVPATITHTKDTEGTKDNLWPRHFQMCDLLSGVFINGSFLSLFKILSCCVVFKLCSWWNLTKQSTSPAPLWLSMLPVVFINMPSLLMLEWGS